MEAFRVKTRSYEAFIQKSAGGISSLLDRDGADWVNFKEVGEDAYPASAAGRFRGFPNMIHNDAERGASHPGFAKAVLVDQTSDSLRFASLKKRWQWRYVFHSDHIVLEVERIPEDSAYWILYEGTPAGVYEPTQYFWATNTAPPSYHQPGFIEQTGVYGQDWQWFYIGVSAENEEEGRSLFLAADSSDGLADQFSYLGNNLDKGLKSDEGMTVVGFSRSDKPLKTTPARYALGFIEGSFNTPQSYRQAARYINDRLPDPYSKTD